MFGLNKVSKILCILCGAVLIWYLFCLPRDLFRTPRSATLLSRDGVLLGARIASDGQWRFGPTGEVSEKFEKCIICFEDKRFRRHIGVDFAAAARALRQNVRGGKVVSGASTITMQVIRLSRPDAPRSVPEKLLEAILATRLELRCSKDEILRLYASNAPFGGNIVGLEAASQRYFGCSSDVLSWAESATLAVLPNSPALIHPGRGRERLLEKRNFLLDKLCAEGIIDFLECALAKDEPLPDAPHPMPDMAYHLLERGRKTLGDGELRSTLDASLQRRVNAIAGRHFGENHNNLIDNMGIIVADVRTGEVLAYYGNTRGLTGGGTLRGADVDMIPAPRSSGSTLKPMLYAAMLQDGHILPSTLIKDTPYNYNNFSPHNFSRSFEGAVHADEVIARSLNVPSVRMLEQYGAERFLLLLRSMGFSTMTRSADHYGLSLILGGAEISLENLAGAYQRMAAKLLGLPSFSALHCFEEAPSIDSADVPLSEGAIWATFEALSKANRPEEEASWMDLGSSRKIAWKTGTSWGSRDAWSVGVDGGHVVAVWVGNSDGEGRSGLTGVSYAAPVMFEVFSALPRSSWFTMPEHDMTYMEICPASGLPAGRYCPERERVMVPVAPATPEECSYHRVVHLDAEGRYQVNSDCCPVSEMVTDTFFVLPPAQEWYFRKVHIEYKSLPPKHPLFESSSSDRNPVAIIYPAPGMTIITTRALDGSRKGAVLKAAHSDPSAVLYWHMDGQYIGSTTLEHELLYAPSPGEHLLTVMDGEGFRRSVRFRGE